MKVDENGREGCQASNMESAARSVLWKRLHVLSVVSYQLIHSEATYLCCSSCFAVEPLEGIEMPHLE